MFFLLYCVHQSSMLWLELASFFSGLFLIQHMWCLKFVVPLQISNTTYAVSGTIPQEMMQAPAIAYWIDVHNKAGKTSDSEQYSIGVKPTYVIDGKLETDIRPTRAEGTTEHPTVYFTNLATKPVYGSVSLVVDGNTVYTSPPQLFGKGQTAVNLEWKTPTVGKISDYQVQAKAEFYGKSFETSVGTITTFPGTKSMSLSDLHDVTTVTENNHDIATAAVLYSSFNNEGTMRYKVIAPDGTCVIGMSNQCLITKSTLGLAGNFKTVTIGDQIFRVRYSGPDSPLERFSITSIDPIVGKWKVDIDTQEKGFVPQAHALDNIMLKVKYRDTVASSITLPSK